MTCIYEEKNLTGHMSLFAESKDIKLDACGYFSYDSITIRPYYTEFMSELKHSASVYVEDYSSDIYKAISEKADLTILICSYDIFHFLEFIKEYKNILDNISKHNIKILFNYFSYLNKDIEREVFFPYHRLPFIKSLKSQKEEIYNIFSEILKEDINICEKNKKTILIRFIEILKILK